MSHDTDSHPTDGRLMAYLDGELSRDQRATVSRHLVGCRSCARTMDELRRSSSVFSDAVSTLSPPTAGAAQGELRRRSGEPGDEGASVAGRIGGHDDEDDEAGFGWSTATRIAASLVVLLGAAAALPGSPVRSWLDRSVQGVQALFGGDEKQERPETVEVSEAPRPEIVDRSGIAVTASEGSIRIGLRDVSENTEIRVRLVDGRQAGVWNAGGQYRTAPGRIRVTSPDSESLLVEIPRSVRRVLLTVNGRLAAVGRSGELDVRVPGVEPRDGEFTFRPSGTQ